MRKRIVPAAVLIVGLLLVGCNWEPESVMTSPPEGIGRVPQTSQEIRVLPPVGYVIEQLAQKGETGHLGALIKH